MAAAPAEPRYDTLHPPLGDLPPPSAVSSEPASRRSVPSSRAPSALGQGQSQVYIVAVAENRMKEVGMAALTIRGAELTMHQFVDSATCTLALCSVSLLPYTLTDLQLLTKLQYYEPAEILLPAGCNELGLVIKNNFAEAEIVTVTRKYYNESRGESIVKSLAHSDDKVRSRILRHCANSAHRSLTCRSRQTSSRLLPPPRSSSTWSSYRTSRSRPIGAHLKQCV